MVCFASQLQFAIVNRRVECHSIVRIFMPNLQRHPPAFKIRLPPAGSSRQNPAPPAFS